MLDALTQRPGPLKLDVKDVKILYELGIDGRQSISRLAKKVKLSKQGVKYKLDRMHKAGLIQAYLAVIDVYRLGYSLRRVFFRLQNVTPEILEDIRAFARGHPNISSISLFFGSWDIAFVIASKDVFEFQNVLLQFYAKFEKFLKGEQIITLTDIFQFRHSYSEASYAGADVIKIGGKLGDMSLDEIDQSILELLSKDGRMPIYEIARQLEVSDKKVVYRMKKLIEAGILLGFTVVLNRDLLLIERYKVILTIRDTSPTRERDLLNFCRFNKSILSMTKVVGRNGIEIDLAVPNKEQVWETIRRMEYDFKDMIGNTLTMMVVGEEQIRYLPRLGKEHKAEKQKAPEKVEA